MNQDSQAMLEPTKHRNLFGTDIPTQRKLMLAALILMTLISVPLTVKREEWGAWATAPLAITAIYAVLLPFLASWLDGWQELRQVFTAAHPKHGSVADANLSSRDLKATLWGGAVGLLASMAMGIFGPSYDRPLALLFLGLFVPLLAFELPRVRLSRQFGPNAPLPAVRAVLLRGSLASVIASLFLAALIGYSSEYELLGTWLAVGGVVALCLLPIGYHWMRYRMVLNWQHRVDQETLRANVAEQAREIAEMQLAILQAQIEPHFLYNTLASVQYLVQRDPTMAVHLLRQLIRYLRQAMPEMRGSRSTLGREMELADAYLEIARIRMGGRLKIAVELSDEAVSIEMPPLMLHTLVENALKHGVEPKLGPVQVQVGAALDGQHLKVWVQDNGVGLGGAPTAGTGTGLRNIRQRLQALYGDEAQLRIESVAAGGVRAEIRLPCRQHALNRPGNAGEQG